MKAPKFNFVPERQLGKEVDGSITAQTVSIFNNGQLSFPRDFVRIYELENKYIQIYADIEHRTIGFKPVVGDTNLESLNNGRLLKADVMGQFKFSIQRILKHFGWVKGMSLFLLEVKQYKSSVLDGEMFYIVIPPFEVDVVNSKSEKDSAKETDEE